MNEKILKKLWLSVKNYSLEQVTSRETANLVVSVANKKYYEAKLALLLMTIKMLQDTLPYLTLEDFLKNSDKYSRDYDFILAQRN
jgi:hypothetical protein